MGRRKDYPFHKSDVDFGTNLVASLITAPFALLLSSTSSTDNYNHIEYKEPTLSERELEYNIDSQLIGNLSNRYKYLKDIYYSNVVKSTNIKNELLIRQNKLSRLSTIVNIFGFIPYIKRTIGNKIAGLERSIKLLNRMSFEPSISTKEIGNQGRIYCNSQLSGYSFVFGEFEGYVECSQRLFGVLKASPFFKMDSEPIVSLNCEYLQLHLLEGSLIIMTQTDFSIIDYNDIGCSYNSCVVSEVGLESLEGLKILGQEWAFARIDGSPDRRHKFNYQRYKIEYGMLVLNICKKFTVRLLFNDYNFGNTIYCMLTNNLSVSQN